MAEKFLNLYDTQWHIFAWPTQILQNIKCEIIFKFKFETYSIIDFVFSNIKVKFNFQILIRIQKYGLYKIVVDWQSNMHLRIIHVLDLFGTSSKKKDVCIDVSQVFAQSNIRNIKINLFYWLL